MDIRAEKLAKARKKLRDHQEKKVVTGQREEILDEQKPKGSLNDNLMTVNKIVLDHNHGINGKQKESIVDMDTDKKSPESKSDTITEMLISNKANLELHMNEMSTKLANLESLYELEISNHNVCKQQNIALQNEISDLKTKYKIAVKEVSTKDEDMARLKEALDYLHDEKNNLFEQVELTKSILNSKELENAQMFHQISSYQSQIDMLQIQLQQLSNDSFGNYDQSYKKNQDTETLLDKIYELERGIEMVRREKDELIAHYDHFAQDRNEQLQLEQRKNEKISKDLRRLYDREQSLVEQISELEIRLQNYNIRNDELFQNEKQDREVKKQLIATKQELEEINFKYKELQKQHMYCQEKIQALTQAKEIENYENSIYKQENVNISKLNADIVSDKLAAQRATEQNEKLKVDMEDLEQIIVKMGKDKLELTEKWTHEKQLNKGLALKLAEVEECVKNLQNQLKAKDDEMIRLLNEYREMERRHENTLKDVSEMKQNLDSDHIQECSHETQNKVDLDNEKTSPLTTTPQSDTKVKLDNLCIPKEDAMIKLQERFLNIMDEVANLSDEKHRLEHIILQLQNETDTICEYVALYQQQRSLLKKREEERSNQLKIFQAECDKLKRHLEELSDLLLRFAADEELASFLKEETRHTDLARVKELLEKLQNCSLINPKFKNLDLNVFYPCHCCSGQLIDI
ncbi:golgin subfamily A member 2-like [Vanessa atalanta]|uniref:golgin subfamily A member 2-like n=1 Tax=Vanessa atalanta TaxID=42275 RepID=UPI001FCE263D|nr:golgin subfamily A member 2-like [Vanessa atalanta]